ncbi:PEP-CTERM sorting domain-containing protein [Thalassotalea sp. LPB0316]|uniref:PEP-CTERM sorting domain-containing protein n=1 Tax=Thalassotalea sp. LPB0316 TaxID=2769490 RepID=UPI001868BB65|nr:PEP-CTERM sorting domain-containing protein [Thalassotalea sp. LPB0316]QOL26566.1 PEP-CTERM sorting domain-containing protein [Thalassotalea sp. LPB0316]
MKKFVLAIVACLSMSANAGLIAESNYVIDTDQGLDWLRWDETNNRSYNDVVSNLSAGGDYDGWQYATAEQAETFLASFGLVGYSSVTKQTTDSAFKDLTSLMGVESTSSQAWIYGMVESEGTKARTYSHYDYSWRVSPEFKIFNLSKTSVAGYLGSFLVRDTSYVAPSAKQDQLPISSGPLNAIVQVSEPSTIILMTLTLGGLLMMRRRQQ